MGGDSLILAFALVMVLLLVAPILSERLRLPGIVGLILAGVLVGEHALGLLRLDLTFELLGKVGLLYLMFLAGLEININEFRRYQKPSLTFGATTFLIPQVLGSIGAHYLLGFGWPKAILLASMFASHTLIPFPIVHRLGIGRHRAVTTTIGATIITDTAALLVLAVIARGGFGQPEATGEGLTAWFWGRMGISLLALLFGSLFLLPRLGYWFFRRSAPEGASSFIFVLAAVFVTAFASEIAGVHAIIGAFLAGLALSSLLPDRGLLTNRLHFVGHALFIPFFLLSVGMRVDVRVFATSLDGWIVAGYMSVCVIAAKWVAAWLAGRMLGYDQTESQVMFGLSVNQAAATLAAVLVGVQLQIFDASVLNGAILMILITCLIGPSITQHQGARLAERTSVSPAQLRRDTGRLLVPLAEPARAEQIVDLAIMIRPQRTPEPMYLLRVVLDGSDVNRRVAEAEHLLGSAVGHAVAANMPVVPLARIDLNVTSGILHTAVEFRISAIVMGWQMPPRHIQFSQSIPEQVITNARAAVLVYRPGPPLSTMKRLWVAVPPLMEQHPGFATAVRVARRLASQAGARLRLAGTQTTLAAMQQLPGLAPSDASVEAEPLRAWADLRGVIDKDLNANDGILLLSVRRGELAWHPSLEQLPVHWAQRHPQLNLIMFHPPQADLPEDDETQVQGDESESPRMPKKLMVAIRSSEFVGAVGEMLRAALPADGATINELAGRAREMGLVPLTDKVAMLHAHTQLIEESQVVIGHQPAGLVVPGYDNPPEYLVLLLSPLSGSAEQHLGALAAVARGVCDGTLITR